MDHWKIAADTLTDKSITYDVRGDIMGGTVVFHCPSHGFAQRMAHELNQLHRLWVDADFDTDLAQNMRK